MVLVEKEIFQFEEMELKALVYLCVGSAAIFMTFEAQNFSDEVAGRKKMEADFMKIIDETLDRKRKK